MEVTRVCRRKTSNRRSLASTGEQSENGGTKLPDADDPADERDQGKQERQAYRFRGKVVRDGVAGASASPSAHRFGQANPRLFGVARRGSRFTHTHTQLDATGRKFATRAAEVATRVHPAVRSLLIETSNSGLTAIARLRVARIFVAADGLRRRAVPNEKGPR
jgi:hypothetical protein